MKRSDLDDFVNCYCVGYPEERKETYSAENPNGRWRKFSIKDIENDEYNLDFKWIKIEDDVDNLSLDELLGELKEKSTNIANAVAELEKLIGEVDK